MEGNETVYIQSEPFLVPNSSRGNTLVYNRLRMHTKYKGQADE